MVKYVILPCPLHEIHVAMVNNIILPSQLFQSNIRVVMVRAVILPSQLPKSKMSSWSDMLSCHVHFLKYNVVMVNSIILLSQDSEIMKSSRWEMLSCQVNMYCENVAIFVILCRHVMKIIWLSRQVEWHLYASIPYSIKMLSATKCVTSYIRQQSVMS